MHLRTYVSLPPGGPWTVLSLAIDVGSALSLAGIRFLCTMTPLSPMLCQLSLICRYTDPRSLYSHPFSLALWSSTQTFLSRLYLPRPPRSRLTAFPLHFRLLSVFVPDCIPSSFRQYRPRLALCIKNGSCEK
ncbi:hypothetical protein BC827DRAFT_260921 [Russula dissimulans]|nr:hypothetical protein BC827DRAFT_260921 [Russula dissimulans]